MIVDTGIIVANKGIRYNRTSWKSRMDKNGGQKQDKYRRGSSNRLAGGRSDVSAAVTELRNRLQ